VQLAGQDRVTYVRVTRTLVTLVGPDRCTPRETLGAVAVTLDSTPYSTLVVCRSCGARFASGTRSAALTLAAAHERAAHPHEHDARRRAVRP
jgi:hypothetical protein